MKLDISMKGPINALTVNVLPKFLLIFNVAAFAGHVVFFRVENHVL